MGNFITKSERLILRKIDQSDYKDLCEFLQDIEVMYAWEYAFSDKEVKAFIDQNLNRYENDGFSYWAVINKENDKLIGVSGLLSEAADNEKHVGIGYIFNKKFWHKGYAYESAKACIDYAFNNLNLNEITAQIRPSNIRSIKVAESLGMKAKKEFTKLVKKQEMIHLLYYLENKR